jgi:hypothetical protein
MRFARYLSLTFGYAMAALVVGPANAGGPFLLRANGQPYVFSTAVAIPYRTDNGPLSASVNEATARARVSGMFNVWQNVNTSSIAYTRAGFISSTTGFSDGDVSTADEFNAVQNDCGNAVQSPVIYDANASIFMALGIDETAVIGFAGPCSISATQYGSGQATMNGLFQDGLAAPVQDITVAEFDAAIVHELGHFSGLDHSQINVNCIQVGCGADDISGLPTMFPYLLDDSQGVLSVDDIAWISRLYPQTTGGTTFANTHGTITGTVFFSDGQSHAQGVNVIARRVDTGANEDRRMAVSVVSGYKFRLYKGNSINDPGTDPGYLFGSVAPGDIGLFEIPVPAGNYTLEVESIDPAFADGSSVGPLSPPIPMPGSAPAPSAPFAVAAGSTSSGHNVVLIGTDPRFDQFEGP